MSDRTDVRTVTDTKRDDELAQPLIVAAIAAASISIGGTLCLGLLRHAVAGAPAQEAMAYLLQFRLASFLLLLSGVGLWWRWPAARQINLVATAAVVFLWNLNYLDGLFAGIPSAILLVQPSVNTFMKGVVLRHYGTPESETPVSLSIFLWLFFALDIVILFTKPF